MVDSMKRKREIKKAKLYIVIDLIYDKNIYLDHKYMYLI